MPPRIAQQRGERGKTLRRLRAVPSAALALALLGLAVTGCGGSSVASKPANEPLKHALKHVFVIVIENHSRNAVIGDPNTPQITALAGRYGQATSYYGVTHPSEPNYLAMIAGRTFGVRDDSTTRRFGAKNLVDQLEAAGRSWAAYEESMPSAGYLGDSWPSSATPLYVSKHNPFVLFDDIRSNPARLARIKPFNALVHDLNGPERSIPDFAFIVPNLCHDMHGGVDTRVAADGSDGTPCPDEAALKRKADAFVGRTARTIMSSKAWTGNSAIFVVGDESDADGDPAAGSGTFGGGLSPAGVIARLGPRPYTSSTAYNHYWLVARIEQSWHLGYLGHAGDVAGGVVPMNDLLVR